MQVTRGFALLDIVQQLLECALLRLSAACWLALPPDSCPVACSWVFRVDMPQATRTALVNSMADCEHRLAFATSERLQLGSLIGAFCLAREDISAAA